MLAVRYDGKSIQDGKPVQLHFPINSTEPEIRYEFHLINLSESDPIYHVRLETDLPQGSWRVAAPHSIAPLQESRAWIGVDTRAIKRNKIDIRRYKCSFKYDMAVTIGEPTHAHTVSQERDAAVMDYLIENLGEKDSNNTS